MTITKNNFIILLFLAVFSYNFSAFSAEKVVILPERFLNQKVMVYNTPEYINLLKENLNLTEQIKADDKAFLEFSKEVDNQKDKNHEIQNKMIKEINKQNLTIETQKTIIAKNRLTIAGFIGLLVTIAIGFVAALYFKVIQFGIF